MALCESFFALRRFTTTRFKIQSAMSVGPISTAQRAPNEASSAEENNYKFLTVRQRQQNSERIVICPVACASKKIQEAAFKGRLVVNRVGHSQRTVCHTIK